MVRPSRPSPQGTPAVLPYPRLSCLSSTSERRAAPRSTVLQAAPAGGGALGAPYAPEARRGGRRGGATRPFACPLREAVHALAPSSCLGSSRGDDRESKAGAVKEGLSHS
jgi:hypothetical protein